MPCPQPCPQPWLCHWVPSFHHVCSRSSRSRLATSCRHHIPPSTRCPAPSSSTGTGRTRMLSPAILLHVPCPPHRAGSPCAASHPPRASVMQARPHRGAGGAVEAGIGRGQGIAGMCFYIVALGPAHGGGQASLLGWRWHRRTRKKQARCVCCVIMAPCLVHAHARIITL